MEYTTPVANVLRQAGWHPSRSVSENVSRWVGEIQASDALVCFDAARRALLEYGGLHIDTPSRYGVDIGPMKLHFDPTLALGEGDRIRAFSAMVGQPAFPLGEADDGHAFICICENGEVYIVMDFVVKVGNNITEAIQNMLAGTRSGSDRIRDLEW